MSSIKLQDGDPQSLKEYNVSGTAGTLNSATELSQQLQEMATNTADQGKETRLLDNLS